MTPVITNTYTAPCDAEGCLGTATWRTEGHVVPDIHGSPCEYRTTSRVIECSIEGPIP